MLAHSLSVSICTDNRLVSRTSVTNELSLLTQAIPMTHAALRDVITAGFKGSFFAAGYREKRAYVRKMLAQYDACVQKYQDEG
jgi:adenosine deaminase